MSETLTIFERGAHGRRAFVAPVLDVPSAPEDALPEHLRRAEPAHLPEVSEPELVRHYVNLSKRNFDLDSGFYPLGSCTMKHNPRLHERVAALPGHARLHPLQDPARAQGALELMWSLQQALGEVAGLPHVSLQPSAGSHGELAGVLLTRAYHEDRGEQRTKVLTPDTAHGTNPATVTMAGYEVVKVGTNADGGVDLDDLRAQADEQVACLMLTNPSTLGLFDANIAEIAEIVHGVGATLYYDGANLNAIMGITRPGDMGFDIVHFNLHKSFTQPHGGGGPGSGPIAVSERIEPYLLRPQVVRREDGSFDLDYERPKSIGRLRGFQGNYGCFVRAYAYICSLGAEGLKDASVTAVLNANYLLALLKREGVAEYLPVAYDRLCMHEFVLSGAPMKRELGIRTLDLAKRLLDYGVHPPTVYFPLLVEEALLIEPTETETRETLEQFAETIAEILREAVDDPELARNAPTSTPVRRLDEAAAAKRPVIRQEARGGEPMTSDASLQPIARSPLYEQVAERLREFIDTQQLQPGDRLMSERELAERLGVSRTSVRQALTALRVMGLVEIRHGDGVYLLRAPGDVIPNLASEIVGSEVDHPMIWEVREGIEVQAARLAARRRTDADVAAMRETLDLMDTAIAGGDDGILEDRRFHHAIVAAAGNPLLRQLTDQLADLIDRTSEASLTHVGRPPISLKRHRAILAAIECQDEAAAAEEMRRHVATSAERGA